MSQIIPSSNIAPVAGSKYDGNTIVESGYKVDPSRGGHDGRLSRQWSSRPKDERFLSLADLFAQVRRAADESHNTIIDTTAIEVVADPSGQDTDGLGVSIKDSEPLGLTNWTFNQLSGLVKAPAGYLKNLPAQLAADCLNYGIVDRTVEQVAAYVRSNGERTLRAITGPEYGRVLDADMVEGFSEMVSRSSIPWKVPGVLDWRTNVYDPYAPVTLDSTTLYASDRDMFVFLVDDTRPIQVGTLKDGSPDLVFRGVYGWNSEVGSKSLGLAGCLLRAVCMNRNLWGVEGLSNITIYHSKNAARRFISEAKPLLDSFALGSDAKVVEGVEKAKAAKVADDDERRQEFFSKRLGFSKSQALKLMARHVEEEGRPVESVWDAAQAITAAARDVSHQNERFDLERIAGKLLAKAAK